jgi:hypothetical protein
VKLRQSARNIGGLITHHRDIRRSTAARRTEEQCRIPGRQTDTHDPSLGSAACKTPSQEYVHTARIKVVSRMEMLAVLILVAIFAAGFAVGYGVRSALSRAHHRRARKHSVHGRLPLDA